jgi:hypothetical protein
MKLAGVEDRLPSVKPSGKSVVVHRTTSCHSGYPNVLWWVQGDIIGFAGDVRWTVLETGA